MTYSIKHSEIIFENLAEKSLDLVSIAGPTCTGKTNLALAIAEELNIPIINADSRLIFAEMNIGTAKPSLNELSKIKHYLVNIKKPNETYSAGEYRKDFDECFAEIKNNSSKQEGPYAIVVGGTGLYLSTALENLDMPEVQTDNKMREELNSIELFELLIILKNLDPNAEQMIDVQNKRRVIRAIELLKSTGKMLSELRSKSQENRYKVISFGLNFSDRATLYKLIDKRVLGMIDQGLIQEVQTLIDKYGVTQTLMATIGYKEIISYLQAQCSLEEAIQEIQKRTRNYAKRQITWFKQKQDIIWLNADENLIPS